MLGRNISDNWQLWNQGGKKGGTQRADIAKTEPGRGGGLKESREVWRDEFQAVLLFLLRLQSKHVSLSSFTTLLDILWCNSRPMTDDIWLEQKILDFEVSNDTSLLVALNSRLFFKSWYLNTSKKMSGFVCTANYNREFRCVCDCASTKQLVSYAPFILLVFTAVHWSLFPYVIFDTRFQLTQLAQY